MKYKAGDKVLIRKWDDMAEEYGTDAFGFLNCSPAFGPDMGRVCGTEVEISEVKEYSFKAVGFDFSFPYGAIEKSRRGYITKQGLEDFMVCRVRVGRVYVVSREYLIREKGFVPLNSYRDDLLCDSEYGNLDIFEVYETTGRSFSEMLDVEKYGTLIWKREEPKEMTLDEIEDALGYKVKIVY